MNQASKPPITFGPIIIDTREQAPFTFEGFESDVIRGERYPLLIESTVGTLKSGDYSLGGHESEISIERKSVEDLFGTIGRNGDRFERELIRLNDLEYAAVIVEGDWDRVIFDPPKFTTLDPKIIFRRVLSWQQKPETRRVHWWFCSSRRFAETVTLRALMRFKSEKERLAKEQLKESKTSKAAGK